MSSKPKLATGVFLLAATALLLVFLLPKHNSIPSTHLVEANTLPRAELTGAPQRSLAPKASVTSIASAPAHNFDISEAALDSDEIKRLRTTLSASAEMVKLRLTPQELDVLTTHFARVLAMNNKLRAERASTSTAPDGAIKISIPPDKDSALALSETAYAGIANELGAKRAQEVLSKMGENLFDNFHGYGLGLETVTITPSSKGNGTVDVTYELQNPPSVVKSPASNVLLKTHTAGATNQTLGVTMDGLMNDVELGYVPLVLSKDSKSS